MCSLLSQAGLLIHLHTVKDRSCACWRQSLNTCQLSWAPLPFRAFFHGNGPFFQSKSRSAPLTAVSVSYSHLPDPSYDPILHVCCKQGWISPLHILSCAPGQQILVTVMGSPWPQAVTWRLPQVTSRLYLLPHPDQTVHGISAPSGHLYCTWGSCGLIFRLPAKRTVFSWKPGRHT